MLPGLLGDHNRLHVLAALGGGPLRFNDLQRKTGLLAPQVDRSLNKLRDDGLVATRGLPPEGKRRPVAYSLTPKGERVLRFLEEVRASAKTHLGARAAAEFNEIFSAHA
jgi:DNA-binding HxlR family transcriptional regulator